MGMSPFSRSEAFQQCLDAFKNTLQLLIGPAFFLAELLRIQRASVRT